MSIKKYVVVTTDKISYDFSKKMSLLFLQYEILDRENSVQDIALTINSKEGSLETWNAKNDHIETAETKE